MKEHGISSVFVVDRERHLKGIITVDAALEARKAGIGSLSEIELEHGPVVREETPLHETLKAMVDSKLPMGVLDQDNKLVGIIVRGSILAALAPDYGVSDSESEQAAAASPDHKLVFAMEEMEKEPVNNAV